MCNVLKYCWDETTQIKYFQGHLGALVRTRVQFCSMGMRRGHDLSQQTFLSIQALFSRNELLLLCSVYHRQLITGHFSICCVTWPQKQDSSDCSSTALNQNPFQHYHIESPGTPPDLVGANEGKWYTHIQPVMVFPSKLLSNLESTFQDRKKGKWDLEDMFKFMKSSFFRPYLNIP